MIPQDSWKVEKKASTKKSSPTRLLQHKIAFKFSMRWEIHTWDLPVAHLAFKYHHCPECSLHCVYIIKVLKIASFCGNAASPLAPFLSVSHSACFDSKKHPRLWIPFDSPWQSAPTNRFAFDVGGGRGHRESGESPLSNQCCRPLEKDHDGNRSHRERSHSWTMVILPQICQNTTRVASQTTSSLSSVWVAIAWMNETRDLSKIF